MISEAGLRAIEKVFSETDYLNMKEAWPGVDLLPFLANYANSLARFHREFPSKDPIPVDKIGYDQAALDVWLEKGVEEEGFLNRSFVTANEGNFERADVEFVNKRIFMVIATKEFPDGDYTTQKFQAWNWINARDQNYPLDTMEDIAVWHMEDRAEILAKRSKKMLQEIDDFRALSRAQEL